MNRVNLLKEAIAIAVQAHRGQRDKFGTPYILHPLRMMCRLESEPERFVAVLHGLVEDIIEMKEPHPPDL